MIFFCLFDFNIFIMNIIIENIHFDLTFFLLQNQKKVGTTTQYVRDLV